MACYYYAVHLPVPNWLSNSPFQFDQEGDVIPLIPYDIRKDEKTDVFQAASANDDTGELDLDLDDQSESPPMSLCFNGLRKFESV